MELEPVTAEERFKWMLANALERNCVLEAQLEKANERIAEQHATLERLAADDAE